MKIIGILDTVADGIIHSVGITERAYITISGKRFSRILSTIMIDSILHENLNKEVTLSICKSLLWGKIICSVKEENGEVTKVDVGLIIFQTLISIFLWFIPFGFSFSIALLVTDGLEWLVVLLWFIFPTISLIKKIKARNSLK